MPLTIKPKTEEALRTVFRSICDKHRQDNLLRDRFLLIDKYVARESEVSQERRKFRMRARQGDKKYVPNTEVPTIFVKLETGLAYLADTFLKGYPIFSSVTPVALDSVSSMMHAMMIRDQNHYKWRKHLIQTLRDGLKYNLHGVETNWHRKFITNPGRQSANDPSQIIQYEGQMFKRLSPYNTIFDTSVPPSMVAEHGVYAGYVELMNFVVAKAFVSSLSDEHKYFKNLSAAFNANRPQQPSTNLYYDPRIIEQNTVTREDTTNWANFFGFTKAQNRANSDGLYEVVVMYLRIIPKDFDITAPRAGTPGVWRTVWVNQMLIYMEQLQGQDSFNVRLSLLNDEGLGFESKSFAENLMDTQDEATGLKNARLSSLRRAISDRALYDPSRVRARDVSSANPEAKIPVKMSQYHKDLASAYLAIPYRDDQAASYNQEYMQLDAVADQISGMNKAFQGSFVKGNKTLYEFEQTMSNAEARLDLVNLSLGSDFFHDIKSDMKANYINYAVKEELFDRKSNGVVEVDPQQLHEQASKIQIADGFTSASKMLSAETVNNALQMLQIPGVAEEFASEYRLAGLIVHMLKNQGLEDLDDFRRPPPTGPQGTPTAGGPTGQPPNQTPGG